MSSNEILAIRYNTEKVKAIEPLEPFRSVPREELRFTTAELNYGMGHSAGQICQMRIKTVKAEIC